MSSFAELKRRNSIRKYARHSRVGGNPVREIVRSTQPGFARFAPAIQ